MEILTAILVLITGFYAWVTHRILQANEAAVRAMEKQSKALSRPYVHATLSLLVDTPIYVLTIKNHGRTAAKNLRITMDRDYPAFGGGDSERNLRELFAFREPIESFAPAAELNFWLGTASDVHDPYKEAPEDIEGFRITLKYEFSGETVVEESTIDFRPFLYSDLPRHHVAHALKEIGKTLENIRKDSQKR